MGGYHTGIVIRSGGEKGSGREFAFARGGVYEVPRPENDPDPDYSFYKRVPLGKFNMRSGQSNVVETNLLHIVQEWSKTQYEMTEHNCNHFTSDVCWRLLGRPNPSWVNHLSDSIEKRQRRNDVMRAGSDALEGWLDRLLAATATAAPQPVQRSANEPQLTQEPPQAREQPQQAHEQRWEQDPTHEHIATQGHVATRSMERQHRSMLRRRSTRIKRGNSVKSRRVACQQLLTQPRLNCDGIVFPCWLRVSAVTSRRTKLQRTSPPRCGSG